MATAAIAAATPIPLTKHSLTKTLKVFATDFIGDDLLSLAAAISFYTTLALSPLLLLALTAAGSLYAPAQERLVQELGALVGPQIEPMLRQIIDSAADRPDLRQAAGWWSLVVLIIGASGVLAQLQAALNRVWNCENTQLTGVWGFLRRRLLSVGVLLSVLFVTIVATGVQVLLSAVPYFNEGLLLALNWAISLLVYAVLFAALYRWLPDCRIPWFTAIRGGLLTAVLFVVGRSLIGVYLSKTDTAGAFGPAGGVILWLLWAYYSALVFLAAAEILYALAQMRGWAWAPASQSPPDERGIHAGPAGSASEVSAAPVLAVLDRPARVEVRDLARSNRLVPVLAATLGGVLGLLLARRRKPSPVPGVLKDGRRMD